MEKPLCIMLSWWHDGYSHMQSTVKAKKEFVRRTTNVRATQFQNYTDRAKSREKYLTKYPHMYHHTGNSRIVSFKWKIVRFKDAAQELLLMNIYIYVMYKSTSIRDRFKWQEIWISILKDKYPTEQLLKNG